MIIVNGVPFGFVPEPRQIEDVEYEEIVEEHKITET